MPINRPLTCVLALALISVLASGCGDDDAAAAAGGASGAGGGDAGDSELGGEAGDGEDACATGGGEASVGPCLVAQYAGSYEVTPSAGDHRGTIVIADDGAIDYDVDLQFAPGDFQGVYDRLECCQRISVEMDQRPDNDTTLSPDARHRVDVFTETSSVGSPVTRFEYYPNWPSEDGKVTVALAD